jgi:Protein of unknown function (DUF4239)
VTPTTFAGVVIVVGCALAGVTGLLAVVRWLPQARRHGDNDVKGVFFGAVAVLYAVLLAFVVVTVWSDFSDAGKATQVEATRASALLRDATAFPVNVRQRVRRRVLEYVQVVVDDEWKTLASGRPSAAAIRAFDALWVEYANLRPRGQKSKTMYQESISRLNELGENRELRVIASRTTLPAPMWILLIAGFVVCIGFTYLFQMESLATQAIAVGAIASLAGFVLFLIFALQHPFAGDVQISADPFHHVLADWRGRPL